MRFQQTRKFRAADFARWLVLSVGAALLAAAAFSGRPDRALGDPQRPTGETQQACGDLPTYAGRIDDGFVAFISGRQAGEQVCISLSGGSEPPAFVAAEMVEERTLSARIVGECTSACVDFLFPAFREVTLVEEPAILIHGNPAYREEKVRQLGGYEALAPADHRIYNARCATAGDRLLDLFARNHVNVGRLTRATDALGFERLILRETGCPLLQLKSDLVSLRRDDLVSIFGAKVKGRACADDDRCHARSLTTGAAAGMPDIIRLD